MLTEHINNWLRSWLEILVKKSREELDKVEEVGVDKVGEVDSE